MHLHHLALSACSTMSTVTTPNTVHVCAAWPFCTKPSNNHRCVQQIPEVDKHCTCLTKSSHQTPPGCSSPTAVIQTSLHFCMFIVQYLSMWRDTVARKSVCMRTSLTISTCYVTSSHTCNSVNFCFNYPVILSYKEIYRVYRSAHIAVLCLDVQTVHKVTSLLLSITLL
jgi:hypothetical protein